MACVELPRDAYGRAIPLDTGTLYKKNGAAVFIYHCEAVCSFACKKIAFGDIESRISKLLEEDK